MYKYKRVHICTYMYILLNYCNDNYNYTCININVYIYVLTCIYYSIIVMIIITTFINNFVNQDTTFVKLDFFKDIVYFIHSISNILTLNASLHLEQ